MVCLPTTVIQPSTNWAHDRVTSMIHQIAMPNTANKCRALFDTNAYDLDIGSYFFFSFIFCHFARPVCGKNCFSNCEIPKFVKAVFGWTVWTLLNPALTKAQVGMHFICLEHKVVSLDPWNLQYMAGGMSELSSLSCTLPDNKLQCILLRNRAQGCEQFFF